MPKGLSPAEIHKLARIGAAARLAELQKEIVELRRAFPGLAAPVSPAKPAAPPVAPRPPLTGAAKATRRGRKHPMTAAERRAVSERMKKYWAERHKSNG